MLVPEHARAFVLRQLFKTSYSLADAEDAFQEACTRFLIVAPPVQNEQEVISWLLTVARRYLIDYYRHADTHTAPLYDTHTAPLYDTHTAPLYDTHTAPLYDTHTAPLYDTHTAPLYDLETTLIAAVVVRSALQALPELDRRLLALKSDGWECEEIAAIWSLSEEAVKKRLQRARSRLRRKLIALGEPDPNV